MRYELGVELDRRIDGLKDDYTKNAQPLQNRIKRLEGDIKDYVDAHRPSFCGKAVDLPLKGGLPHVQQADTGACQVAEAIAALKAPRPQGACKDHGDP